MPFNRPTPTEILNRLEVELNAAFPGADAKLRNSVEAVLARLTAMAAHEMFGFLDWLSDQILPDTAEQEFLVRHGTIWNILRKAAGAAEGTITFTGTNGSTVPAGSILRRADNVEYSVDVDITVAGGTGTGVVTCLTPGASGNAGAGVKINLISPVAGVQSQANVTIISGGTDVESDEELRGRIIARIQKPPQGGAAHDYEAWALEVPGVTRAWPYPMQYGLGTVGLTFVMDNKAGTIIPSAGEVASVQTHIDDPAVRPVTADVTVFAPVAVPVNLEIHISPNSLAVQKAVKAELEAFFRREATPGGTLYKSRINEAISTAAGEFDHVLVTPSADIVMTFGQMPVIGTFTWAGL